MRSPESELESLREKSLLRHLRPVDSPQLPNANILGQEVTNFASNDYLGLANHPTLIQAAQDAAAKWGTGSGASRLICGSLPPHRLLEQHIASAKGTQATITFANGYATAVGTLSALLQKGDTVILDKLSHASLIDGAKLSGATIRVFPHNNLTKLQNLLETVTNAASPDSRTIVVTESIFSMDGDQAPLQTIADLKNNYPFLLLVDEAHALGIFGKTGMGVAQQLNISDKIDLHMGTLGKAAGSAGGYLATSQAFADLITNRARSFIYSTAPPPAQSATSLAALELIQSQEGTNLRQNLWKNLQLFADLTNTPLPTSPIIPWIIGDSQQTLNLSQNLLQNHNIFAPPVRYPTVPKNQARLRITLTATHTPQQIQALAKALNS